MALPTLASAPHFGSPCCTAPELDILAKLITAEDLEAWRRLVALQTQYNLQAARKRSFGVTIGTGARKVPFTVGRILSIFIPSATVWMGGDPSVTVEAGGAAGLPVVANQTMIFGPEEGSSSTYLIAASPAVDVRCFELLLDRG